jgi:hypothetical protein
MIISIIRIWGWVFSSELISGTTAISSRAVGGVRWRVGPLDAEMQLLANKSHTEHTEMMKVRRSLRVSATSNFWLCLCLFTLFAKVGVERIRAGNRTCLRKTACKLLFSLWLSSLLVLGRLYIALGSSDWSTLLLDLTVSTLKPLGPWLLILKPLRLLQPKSLFSHKYQLCKKQKASDLIL